MEAEVGCVFSGEVKYYLNGEDCICPFVSGNAF